MLLAGGIADAADVARALDAGADAAVLGTRFVMSEEANAALAYKQRLMESRETVLTELFGMGWPRAAPRPLERGGRALARPPTGASPAGCAPCSGCRGRSSRGCRSGLQARIAGSQAAGRPFFGPLAPTADGPRNLLDAGALYAGESVARLHDIRPAADLVRDLAPAA